MPSWGALAVRARGGSPPTAGRPVAPITPGTMKRSLLSVDLRLALKEPGCPICRLRADAELRYIRSLLWEFVNDPLTRSRFIASLGYCREHTWQVGLLEKEKFGSSLGTAILYEHLTRVVSGRLKDYTRRMGWARRPWWKRWLVCVLALVGAPSGGQGADPRDVLPGLPDWRAGRAGTPGMADPGTGSAGKRFSGRVQCVGWAVPISPAPRAGIRHARG